MKKLYLVTRSELPRELPAEIIRGFTTEEKAKKFFMDLTGVTFSAATDAVDYGEWTMSKRLLDDNCFYGITQTELDES